MTTKPTGKDYVGSDDMYAEVQRTMRLVAEMNTGYHTEAEVRQYLSEITVSEVPDTVRVFTPFNINYGRTTRFGDDSFVNFGCTFLALGGITIEDDHWRKCHSGRRQCGDQGRAGQHGGGRQPRSHRQTHPRIMPTLVCPSFGRTEQLLPSFPSPPQRPDSQHRRQNRIRHNINNIHT